MRLVTIEEYEKIKAILKKEMTLLAKHENKNSYYSQIAISQCFCRQLNEEKHLYQAFTMSFINVIERDYINALKETPNFFGTGNAKDVIHALYLQAIKCCYPWDEKRYTNYLSNEAFCLLLCKEKEAFDKNILRVDLFRRLDKSKKKEGCFDFTGGIFHALKHFSIDEQCASILPNQNMHLYDIEQLIWPIAKAYYCGIWRKGDRVNTFETSTSYLNKQFTLEFYKENDINVSFVNSVIPKS